MLRNEKCEVAEEMRERKIAQINKEKKRKKKIATRKHKTSKKRFEGKRNTKDFGKEVKAADGKLYSDIESNSECMLGPNNVFKFCSIHPSFRQNFTNANVVLSIASPNTHEH